MSKKYQRNSIISRESALLEIKKSNQSRDKLSISNCFKSAIKYLDYIKMFEYYDLIEIFKCVGFKSKQIRSIFINFKQASPKKKLHWLSTRNLTKMNLKELNIVMNRLVLQYSNEITSFIESNLPADLDDYDKRIIINELKKKIDGFQNKSNFQVFQDYETDESDSSVINIYNYSDDSY